MDAGTLMDTLIRVKLHNLSSFMHIDFKPLGPEFADMYLGIRTSVLLWRHYRGINTRLI